MIYVLIAVILTLADYGILWYFGQRLSIRSLVRWELPGFLLGAMFAFALTPH